MQTGGANPKKKERLTNRSERVMKRAVKNWEFARDVHNSGTTNRGELAQGEAMQNKAQRQGERAKKIRAKAEKYQVGGVTNAGSDSIKAKAAAAAKAKAMKAMKTTGSKVGKTSTGAAKKYKIGGMVNPNSNVSKQTVPGSRGVKSGVNPKAAASKAAHGRVGGTSVAPKGATPKAQMGGGMYGNTTQGPMYGSGISAGKSKTTMSGGTKYKDVNYGPLVPGAKGSVSKTKTDAQGNLIKTSTKSISQNRANRMIDRMSGKAQMGAEISPYSPNYKPHGEPKAGGAKLKKPKAFTRGAARKFHKMIKKS